MNALLTLLAVSYAAAVAGLLMGGASLYDATVKGGPGTVVIVLFLVLIGGDW